MSTTVLSQCKLASPSKHINVAMGSKKVILGDTTL